MGGHHVFDLAWEHVESAGDHHVLGAVDDVQIAVVVEAADVAGANHSPDSASGVRALSQINVLDVRRGDGTYVTSLAPSELLPGLVFVLELVQAKDLDEVVEVRQLLLPPAAALAAERVTEDQLARMHEVLEHLEQATDPDEIVRLHEQFGSLVYEATGNETLSSILRALQLRGENVRRAWLSAEPTRRDIVLADQRMLLEALQRGDSDMAQSISVVQVERRRRWIERLRTRTTAEPLLDQPVP